MANSKTKYPFKMNGYIYSPGTRAGFELMKRMGIPRPIFRIEDRLTRIAKAQYRRYIRQLLRDVRLAMAETNVTQDHAPLVQDDSLDDLMEFFDKMKEESEKETSDIINRANMGAAENTLSHKWFDGGDEDVKTDNQEITKAIGNVLEQEQKDYLGRLFEDAGDRMQQLLVSFSIDKQEVFNDNMDNLRKLYLDNSIQRLGWEEEYLKKWMLERIHRYVTGQDKKLRLDDLTNLAYSRSDNLARLFARDQMARFNKALTLSTFTNAGVTKVKWVTSHDARVRTTHKALDGRVFDINNLPDEVDDYNCRCGLVPVEWAD